MADHVLINCPKRDIECEYHYAGCHFKKPKPQLEQHMKDSVSLHLSLVSDQMSSVKEKVYELKNELREYKKSQRKIATGIVIASILFVFLLVFLNMWQIDSSVLKMKEDLSTQQQASKLEVMNLTNQQFEVLREELKEYLSTTSKLEIDRLVKQTYSENTVSSQFSDTSSKCVCPSLPEAKLNIIETEIEYLRQRLDYPSLPVLIKYTELKDCKSGDCLLSMPFYACASESCMSGYHMRLAVYPNGIDDGANTHMSLFIYLMKGNYDSILSWPFRGGVEVILHYGGDQKVSCIINPPSNSEFRSRVLDGTMSAHGLGYHRFMSHEDITLKDNTSLYFVIKLLSPGSSASYYMPSIKFPDIIVVLIVSVVCIMLAKCIQ
jgi:hypothetical protein